MYMTIINVIDIFWLCSLQSKNLRHLYPGIGLQNLGVFGFFRDQNNLDSSGSYVLRSECEDKHA